MNRRDFFKYLPLLPVVAVRSAITTEKLPIKKVGDLLSAQDWNALVRTVERLKR